MRHTIIAMWLLTCLLYTIDTDVFLFASLSQTLLGGMCALMMCVFSLAYGLLNGASWPAGKGVAFVFIWIAYLLCHASLVAEAEQYKLFYLVIQLVVMLMLSFLLHNRFLSFRQIKPFGEIKYQFINQLIFQACIYFSLQNPSEFRNT